MSDIGKNVFERKFRKKDSKFIRDIGAICEEGVEQHPVMERDLFRKRSSKNFIKI
jgi:hypothetical protein